LVAAEVHAADIQDRDGAVPLLASIRWFYLWLRHVFGDGGYAGAKLAGALATLGRWTLEIIKRSDARGFEPLPRRWVVERTPAGSRQSPSVALPLASIDNGAPWEQRMI
jgi:putative transposase